MTTLEHRAEVLKLERALHRADGDLSFLERLDVDVVRALRATVETQLREQGADAFGALLAASQLLPDKLVASIAQRVFPPLLCAQMAGSLSPDRAVSLVRHFRPAFLAELSAHVAPETIEHIVPALPHDVIVAVAREVDRRQDHLTGGRLVGLAPGAVMGDLVAAVADDATLLEIAFLLEHPQRLDEIVRAIPDARLDRVLLAAAEGDRWAHGLSLTAHLSDTQLARLAARTAAADPAVVDSLVAAATDEDMWDELLPLVAHLSDDDVPAVAGTPALLRRDTLVAVLDAAEATGGRDTVARVVLAMDESQQQALAALVPDLGDERVAALVEAAGPRDPDGTLARLLQG